MTRDDSQTAIFIDRRRTTRQPGGLGRSARPAAQMDSKTPQHGGRQCGLRARRLRGDAHRRPNARRHAAHRGTRTRGPATVSIVDAPAETASGFKGQLIAAISKARQAGDISFREALALRVACFSPSFVESAEKLAITQMAFSEQGAEYLPMSADGTIDQTAIDWENFATFIERLVPIILTLLEAFGVI
jgi:hypothetical protein